MVTRDVVQIGSQEDVIAIKSNLGDFGGRTTILNNCIFTLCVINLV